MMVLTSKFILDIMDQIEKENPVIIEDYFDDKLYDVDCLDNRWKILKERLKNLEILR